MIVLDFIRQQMPGGWKQTPSGWVSGNCPMCATRGHSPDKRKRGGIMFHDDQFQYNCFNCGFKTGWRDGRRIAGKLADLLKVFGTDESDIQRINFELLREQEAGNIAGQYIEKQVEEKIKIDWPAVELPPNSYRIGEYPIDQLDKKQLEKLALACTYVMKRGLDFCEDWHWSPHMHFANRVILPFYYKDWGRQGPTRKIVGYTARWCPENRPEAMPKYYNNMPKNFVYNLVAQETHDTVVVTEGQLDALQMGGVALAGNTPNSTQCKIIEDLDKQIVLLPDFDNSGMDTVNVAVKRGWAVSFPPWEKDIKDASDAVIRYGRLFTVKSVLESTETNATKIKILAKTRCR
jgi:hypothetical protein